MTKRPGGTDGAFHRSDDQQALSALTQNVHSPLPVDFIVAAYRSLSKFIYDACLRGRFGR